MDLDELLLLALKLLRIPGTRRRNFQKILLLSCFPKWPSHPAQKSSFI
jgi:hypothetical protein